MALTDAAVGVATSLLAASDAASRAAVLAGAVVEAIPDCACAVHRFGESDGEAAWVMIGMAGEISMAQPSIAPDNPLIAPLLSEPLPLIYAGTAVRREDYSHLHIARSLFSLAYVPLLHEGRLTGAFEILTFAGVLDPEQLEDIGPVIQLASPAILAGESADQERQTLLDSVHRMSQLYDLEKSLNATLELDALTALIPEKAMAMLPCQAIHLWLFEGASLRLTSTDGQDATVEAGMTQAAGEGYVADMAEEGEPLLISDPDDERLALRNEGIEADSPPVTNALMVPLIQDEAEVGVLEAVNREDHPFDEDDQFLLSAMAETISSALKNATLMLAERKLEILEALVRVSSEITSTLRLDRLLQIIANSPQNVLPYELCAIALDHRGRLELKAVSGMASLPLGDVQVERIKELLRWLSAQTDILHLRQHEESERSADLPAPVVHHFEETGYRALYSLPLTDDQGRVGLLLYESSEPDFLDLPHTEMIKVLAGQATVAIRNALLYREVPLISLLEPLIQKRAALLRTSGRRWLVYAAMAAAVVLVLVFCPLPMRVTGNATVAPQHLVVVSAPEDANVESVLAHEGQRVAAGEVLGTLNDWAWRTELSAAEARYQRAMLVMQDDLAHGNAQAGADRAQAEYLRAEVARARSRMDQAQLRSPIAGIVATADLQNAAGKHLAAGASFAEVLDLNSAVIQIAVPQGDAVLVRSGQSAAIKLDSYPRRTWRENVAVISPVAHAGDGDRSVMVEVPVQNSDGVLRAGMSGRAKIFIGWRPAGYVLLRGIALWSWQTLWNWIGW